MPSLNKQLKALIANRPKYQIQPEAYQNQALAGAAAFGRDRSIQGMEGQVDQSTADMLSAAQQNSATSGSILNTLQKLNESRNSQYRNLAVDEAAIQRQKLNDLYQVNQNLIDEQDKAWNYNVNEPYQNQMQMIRDKKKARQENMWKIFDTLTAAGTSLATGGMSGVAKAAGGAL